MEIATKSVSFSFNETMYRQIDGISKGSPLGPILANIFVGFHEGLLFERCSRPALYLRYVDDTFACFSCRDEALEFFQMLNNLHPSLVFTMEEEHTNTLPFLDVLVERHQSNFVTSIYRKPTFSGLYLSWDSFAPKARKINLIKCLTFRALNICSDSKIEGELQVITDIFKNNGYPEEVISHNIHLTVSKFKNKRRTFGPPKCPVYFRLPWIGPASQTFASKIVNSVSRCYNAVEVRTILTTRAAFRSFHKDVLPITQQSLLIYKFKCCCSSTYIGRTIQRQGIRIRQHVPLNVLHARSTSGFSQASDSAVRDHLEATNSCRFAYNDDWFSVLHKARDKHHLKILEAVQILLDQTTLYRQRTFQSLYLGEYFHPSVG